MKCLRIPGAFPLQAVEVQVVPDHSLRLNSFHPGDKSFISNLF